MQGADAGLVGICLVLALYLALVLLATSLVDG